MHGCYKLVLPAIALAWVRCPVATHLPQPLPNHSSRSCHLLHAASPVALSAVAFALLATQAVKAQLERQRDLDGIDISNIVGNEGRRPRRAAAAAASVAAR